MTMELISVREYHRCSLMTPRFLMLKRTSGSTERPYLLGKSVEKRFPGTCRIIISFTPQRSRSAFQVLPEIQQRVDLRRTFLFEALRDGGNSIPVFRCFCYYALQVVQSSRLFFTIRVPPVITSGLGSPNRSRTVGATSRRPRPVPKRIPGSPTIRNGTG